MCRPRTLLTVLALHLLTCGVAQVTFQRTYDLPSGTTITSASTMPDGGLVLTGRRLVNAPFDTRGYLMRLDAAGDLLWAREYQGSGLPMAGTTPGLLCQNSFNGVSVVNNDLLIVGGTGGYCDPNNWPPIFERHLLAAVDGAGNVRWATLPSGTSQHGSDHLVPNSGSQVLLAGWLGVLSGTQATLENLLVTDTSCTILGDTRLRRLTPPNYSERITDVERGQDGLVRLSSRDGQVPASHAITKLTGALALEWSITWSDFLPERVGGWANGGTCAMGDTSLIALTATGTFDWGLKLDLPGGTFRDLQLRPTGEVLVLGRTTGADPCSWLMQLSSSGSLQWIQRFGNSTDPLTLEKLMLMPDGSVRLTGTNTLGQLVLIAADANGALNACSFPAITASFLPYTPIVSTPLLIDSLGLGGYGDLQTMLAAPNYIGPLPFTCTSSTLNLQATGRVFVDNDQDGAYGTGDAPVPFNALQVTPDTGYVFTDPDGSYLFVPPAAGIFTIAPAPLPSWWTVTTDSASYTVDLNAVTPLADSLDFGLGAAVDTTVVQGQLVSPPFGCLYPVGPWASVQNLGTTTPELHITFTFDPLLSLNSTVPPADSVVGNVIHWHVDSLAHFGSLMLSPLYNTPSFMNIGDTVHLVLQVHEVDSLGNLVLLAVDTVTEVITCAYDPNDKQVEPLGDGPDGFIGASTEWLTYTVRFQNTGNDTAQTVVVEDLLSQHLQWGTLQVLGASHTLTGVSVNPYGLAAFRFDGIMLPDSGANGPASQGYVRFRLRPNTALPHRTRIENTAGIHFDLNPAVVTNTVLNTVFDCSSIPWQAQIVEYAGYFGADPTLEANGPMYTYQWYLNGSPIPGANGFVPYYTPTQNGNYTVLITDEDGCTSVSAAVSFVITSGPDPGPKPASLATVVPNPFGEATEVRFLQHVPASTPLTLVDAHGRVVRSMRSDGSSVLALPRSELAPGLYVLRIGELGSVRMAVE